MLLLFKNKTKTLQLKEVHQKEGMEHQMRKEHQNKIQKERMQRPMQMMQREKERQRMKIERAE